MKPETITMPQPRSTFEIELEARRMRAETLAAAGASIRRALARAFARRPKAGRPAHA